jgi:hypothetical protein
VAAGQRLAHVEPDVGHRVLSKSQQHGRDH